LRTTIGCGSLARPEAPTLAWGLFRVLAVLAHDSFEAAHEHPRANVADPKVVTVEHRKDPDHDPIAAAGDGPSPVDPARQVATASGSIRSG
jgi:hypothetical protein